MSKRLLLADDSVTIQKVIEITFADKDYTLVTASDGDEALKLAAAERPDLIMADVFMPGKDGYQVCDAVRRDPALKDVPVLLLAGTFEPFDKEKASQVGANDFIVKPFSSQSLIDKVEELLAAAGAASAQDSWQATPLQQAPGDQDILQALEEVAEVSAGGPTAPATPTAPAAPAAPTAPTAPTAPAAPAAPAAPVGAGMEETFGGVAPQSTPETESFSFDTAETEQAPAGSDDQFAFDTPPVEVASVESGDETFSFDTTVEEPTAQPFSFEEPTEEKSAAPAFAPLPKDLPPVDDVSFEDQPAAPAAPVEDGVVALAEENIVEEGAYGATEARVERRVAYLSDEQLTEIVERVAGAVIERLAAPLLEQVVWEVVPDLAESMVREEMAKIKPQQ